MNQQGQSTSEQEGTTTSRLRELALELGTMLETGGQVVCTAESCTGGLIASTITEIAGSSGWFERGYVTYANTAKTAMLGVDPETLRLHGAVSEAVVREMVSGALRESGADIAVAVSGIAGPGGAVAGKPVGTVWIAWGGRVGAGTTRGEGPKVDSRNEVAGFLDASRFQFAGDRQSVRLQAVAAALHGTIRRLQHAP